MKKLLPLLVLLQAGLLAYPQVPIQSLSPVKNPRMLVEPRSPVLTNQGNTPVNGTHTRPANNTTHASPRHPHTLKSLSNGMKLNEQRIGSAGNMLTVENDGSDQIATDQASNSVVFIHRLGDVQAEPGTNLAEYGYDFSQDGGGTWSSNLGPVTRNPRIDNNNVNGRFPQGTIFNPNGGSVAKSNYLVYSGTWHDECTTCSASASHWVGQMRGVAQLDTSNVSSYTVGLDTVNNGLVSIATSFCQGAPGTFWNINEANSGNLNSSDNLYGLIVEKGIWNSNTNTVSWTDRFIGQQFDSVAGTGNAASVATAFNIAFDPSGQYGWIACLGDISNSPVDSVYSPIFWWSTDSGATWNGPSQISLDSLPGVKGNLKLNPFPDYIQNPLSGVPTTSFEAKLEVDYLGNPHLFTTVGNGGGYAISEGAGYIGYDISYNANRASCDSSWNGWAATIIDTVYTLVGSYTTDSAQEYNRPLAARSADGTKLFWFWLDTDTGATQGLDANSYPNLFTRAFDLKAHSSTAVINLTENDSLFAGSSTENPLGGLYLPGANFPVVAETALQNGSSYNVGVVLTQIDYENNPDGGVTGSSANPAAFWYINNVNFSPSDFTNGQVANVQVIGSDTEIIVLGTSYVDSGAYIIYTDTSCFPVGLLHLVTDSSNLNIGATGTYTVDYVAEDSNGTVYGGAQRVIEVVAPPVANFGYSVISINNPGNLAFHDSSTNQPTEWSWDFGDTSSVSNHSTVQNPTHNFHHTGTYSVCLTATNAYGADRTCKSIGVIAGINNVDLSEHISLFPNPSSGTVFISVDASVTSDYTVSIYDILGNRVMAPVEHKQGAANLELDLSALPGATYMVKIQTGNETAVKRLTLIRK